MNIFKALWIGLACVVILLFATMAKSEIREGTKIATKFICLDEESIMYLTAGDAESAEEYLKRAKEVYKQKRCGPLTHPTTTYVRNVLKTYVDHNGVVSTVAEVYILNRRMNVFDIVYTVGIENSEGI